MHFFFVSFLFISLITELQYNKYKHSKTECKEVQLINKPKITIALFEIKTDLLRITIISICGFRAKIMPHTLIEKCVPNDYDGNGHLIMMISTLKLSPFRDNLHISHNLRKKERRKKNKPLTEARLSCLTSVCDENRRAVKPRCCDNSEGLSLKARTIKCVASSRICCKPANQTSNQFLFKRYLNSIRVFI